jgi:hypothetical protein
MSIIDDQRSHRLRSGDVPQFDVEVAESWDYADAPNAMRAAA